TEGVEILKKYPELAGVCGFYKSASNKDYNTLRDIKRHSIYKKNDKERIISLKDFTTFSTGIAMMKREVILNFPFEENDFPNDFGGEDVPVLLSCLNHGYKFYYSPKIRGVHEHNLSFKQFIKKMEIEIRGRFSLLFWASNHPEIDVPYLHGFLNFPYLFLLSLFTTPLFLVHPLFLIIPLIPFMYEFILSLQCFKTPVEKSMILKLKATLYVFTSDILSIFCFLQYLICSYKRPWKNLGFRRFVIFNRIFLNWERSKYGLKRKN
ncbi:MAG: hypothetical protein ACTSPI_07095, partial [Candidatus Heimdallarchaeaceae archaeon]